MSLPNLHELDSDNPTDREALKGLEAAYSHADEFNFDSLVQMIHPASEKRFQLLLGELVRQGFLNIVFRVEEPGTGGGIQDFHRIEDVPDQIFSWRTSRTIPVFPENIRVLYQARHEANVFRANC